MTLAPTQAGQNADRDPTEMRRFSAVLAGQEDGRFDTAATETLRELLARMGIVRNARGSAKGSMTIKIHLNLTDEVVEMVMDCSVSMPKLPRAKSVLWVTKDGNLSQSNPRQRGLPFRDVTMVEVARETLAVRDATGGAAFVPPFPLPAGHQPVA